MFHIVLVEPEIPVNTGNIARSCLATGSELHLIKPLGFVINDRRLKRAGLNYWKEVKVTLWDSIEMFLASLPQGARCFYLTTKCARPCYDATFQRGDYLIFGRETKGLPEKLLAANQERLLTIPMTVKTRSLNLATAVGIVLFEAIRQTRQHGCVLTQDKTQEKGTGHLLCRRQLPDLHFQVLRLAACLGATKMSSVRV